MPLYVYVEVLPDGSEGETLEVIQKVHDEPLTQHPTTGRPLKRKVTAPFIPTPFDKRDKKEQLSDRNLEKLGFTKYVKGKDGYEKTCGDGPNLVKKD